MNTFQISVLIRELLVLAMLALMVVAGALLARRRPSNGDPDVVSDASSGPSVVQHSQHYAAGLGSRNSNDADVDAPAHAHRRAA